MGRHLESLPPMVAGDIYVFTHATHAISVVDDAGHHELMTLGDARRTVVDVNRAGNTVWLGAEDSPVAVEAAQALAGPGIHFEDFSAGARPGAPDTLAPLAAACRDGLSELMADLLARGADVNTPDSFGLMPIHYTSAAQNDQATRRLLEAGAKKADQAAAHESHLSSDTAAVKKRLRPAVRSTDGSSERIKIPADNLLMHYMPIVAKGPVALFMFAMAVLLYVDDQSLVGVVMGVVFGIGLSLFLPSWRSLFLRSTLTSVTGTHLVLSRPFLPAKRLDLARAGLAAATGPVFVSTGLYGSFYQWDIVVTHPDGFDIPKNRRMPRIINEKSTSQELRIVSASLFARRGHEATERAGRALQAAGVTLDESYLTTCRDLECLFASAPSIRGLGKKIRQIFGRKGKQ